MAFRTILGTIVNPNTGLPWDGGRVKVTLVRRFASGTIFPQNTRTYTCDENGYVEFQVAVPDGGALSALYRVIYPDNTECLEWIAADDVALNLADFQCMSQGEVVGATNNDPVLLRLAAIEAILACLNLKPATDGQVLVFRIATGVYSPEDFSGGGLTLPNGTNNGDILIWQVSGGQYVAASFPIPNGSNDGDVPLWDGDSSSWTTGPPPVGLPTGTNGQIIRNDSGTWIATDFPIPDGTNDDDVPFWNSGAWDAGPIANIFPDGTNTGDVWTWNGTTWVAQAASGGGGGTAVPPGTRDRNILQWSQSLAAWVESNWPLYVVDGARDGWIMTFSEAMDDWVGGAPPPVATADQYFVSNNVVSGGIIPLAIFEQRGPNNASGGAAQVNTWLKRDINTVVHLSARGISLDNDAIFTLPEGVYFIKCKAMGYRVNRHFCGLFNEDTSEIVYFGFSAYSDSSNFVGTTSSLETVINVSSTTRFSLRHRFQDRLDAGVHAQGSAAYIGGVGSMPRDQEMFANIVISGTISDENFSGLLFATDFESLDSSGGLTDAVSGNALTPVGTISLPATGVNGNAATIDSSNYLVGGHSLRQVSFPSSQFSILFFIQLSSGTATIGQMQDDAGIFDWKLQVSASQVIFDMGSERRTLNVAMTGTKHVAFCWVKGFPYLYIDGVLMNWTSSLNAGDGELRAHSDRNFIIGGTSSGTFDIDELRMFDSFAPNGTVAHWYNSGSGRTL